jgi:hypothetical protein
MADMYPAFNFGNLITEREKQLIKEQEAKDFAEKFSKFADPNYEPKSIMDKFAMDPDYNMMEENVGPLSMSPMAEIKNQILKEKSSEFDSAMSSDLKNIKAVAKKNADVSRKIKAEAEAKDKAAKAKAEKEKFVPKDTVLGRIFDKRVRPGEEISNLAKTNAMLRNISDNLLERRVVGGKEGTSTLSRILGPGGGIREGFDEIESLKTAAEAKDLAAILADQKFRKSEADIKKVIADTALKNAGINTENMDSNTKFAYYQTLAELGESNINTPMFQKKLLENMNKQQSVEILDNIGPEYTKALEALRVETPGTPEHDRALKMLQLYGNYLPELEDMAETTEVQSAKELTNS